MFCLGTQGGQYLDLTSTPELTKIIVDLNSYDISGGTPYPTINNRELLRLLKSGYRMEKPENCADPM